MVKVLDSTPIPPPPPRVCGIIAGNLSRLALGARGIVVNIQDSSDGLGGCEVKAGITVHGERYIAKTFVSNEFLEHPSFADIVSRQLRDEFLRVIGAQATP